jgi:hypothetical protein
VAGSSLYLTVIVVIGLALGALLRKTAAGLSVFAAVFFVLPIVVGALPHQITGFAPYLPANAGGALWGNTLTTGHELSPWAGFAVLCGYSVVLTGLAAWRLRRRDARPPAKRRGHEHVFPDTDRKPGDAPAASPGFRHRCIQLGAVTSRMSFSRCSAAPSPAPRRHVRRILQERPRPPDRDELKTKPELQGTA